MRLRAFIHGKEIIAPFLSESDWEGYRQSIRKKEYSLTLPCCQASGFLRVSKLGTRHFVHQSSRLCDWKPETKEHLHIKTEILTACSNAGYEAVPEAVNPAWRADVLAKLGASKIAFEVRWRGQSLEETLRRQERYREDGIEGVWFFRRMPKELEFYFDQKADALVKAGRETEMVGCPAARADLPLFELKWDSEHHLPFILLNERQIPFSSFIHAYLQGKVKFRSIVHAAPMQKVRIVFFERDCWREQCKRVFHVYCLDGGYRSGCGIDLSNRTREMNVEEEVFRKEITAAVDGFLKTARGRDLKVGKIKPRFSRTEGRSYTSFGCYYCDVLYGRHYYHEDTSEGLGHPSAVFETVISLSTPMRYIKDHWCYPEDGICCGSSKEPYVSNLSISETC